MISLKTIGHWARTWQSDYFHVLTFAPVLTLSFLSLVVRTADSAVDFSDEKKKVAQHLRHRLQTLQEDKRGLEHACYLFERTAAHTSAVQLEPGSFALTLREQTGLTTLVPQRCEAEPAPHVLCGAPHSREMSVSTCQDTTPMPGFSPFLSFGNAQWGSSAHFPQSLGQESKEKRSPLSLAANPLLINTIRDPLARRVVSLTAAFEHGEMGSTECFETVTGDFDGQVLSFGILQWNLGSCTLQPLLRAFQEKDPRQFRASLGDGATFIERLLASSCEKAVTLARREFLTRKGQVKERWLNRFRALGRIHAFQEVQLQFLLPYVQKAYRLADEFGFHSERAIALFFDIIIQNGGIPTSVRAQYTQDLQEAQRRLRRRLNEVERMELLARRQAEAANPRWVETVWKRKFTIARGKGNVNGIRYDLDSVGIKLRPHQLKRALVVTDKRTGRQRSMQKREQG